MRQLPSAATILQVPESALHKPRQQIYNSPSVSAWSLLLLTMKPKAMAGRALSASVPFDYLRGETIENVVSEGGRPHLRLWLTKRPGRMAEFGM